jgi:hypothetical protein
MVAIKVFSVPYRVRSESLCALRLRYADLIQACIDARGRYFEHLLQVHIEFPSADLKKVLANEMKLIQACIDAREPHFQLLL